MKPMLLAATFGALLATPLAHAQPPARTPDPSDPGAAVPQPAYASALTGYSRLPRDEGATPDKTWRQVNEAVAAAPGHAAHGPAPAAAPPKPAQPSTAAAASRQHH